MNSILGGEKHYIWAMEESFDLTVEYRKMERVFEARFERWGYSYRFQVVVDGTVVYFEPDEERVLRAVIPPPVEGEEKKRPLPGGEKKGPLPAPELLQKIAEKISELLS